jgi:hypothetical protein
VRLLKAFRTLRPGHQPFTALQYVQYLLHVCYRFTVPGMVSHHRVLHSNALYKVGDYLSKLFSLLVVHLVRIVLYVHRYGKRTSTASCKFFQERSIESLHQGHTNTTIPQKQHRVSAPMNLVVQPSNHHTLQVEQIG